MKQQWIPGLPRKIEPDRLYAVLMQPSAGYSVGIVIRGEDCNWNGSTLGHFPLPITMNSAEACRMQRTGKYEWPAPPVSGKDSYHCERDDCGRGPNPACPEYEPAAELPNNQNEPTTLQALKARATEWLREPAPDNGEPEPKEIAEARAIMEMVLHVGESGNRMPPERDKYREALISTGCHDLFCAEAKKVCSECPVSKYTKMKLKKEATHAD